MASATTSADYADYSGVATRDLAALIRKHVPEGNRETWAALHFSGIKDGMREIRKILAEERPWKGIIWSDRIHQALGLLWMEIPIIPSSRANAAKKMAIDELEVAFEFGLLDYITDEDIERRTAELEQLRIDVLGPPTEDQILRAAKDRERQTESKKRKGLAG